MNNLYLSLIFMPGSAISVWEAQWIFNEITACFDKFLREMVYLITVE